VLCRRRRRRRRRRRHDHATPLSNTTTTTTTVRRYWPTADVEERFYGSVGVTLTKEEEVMKE